MGTTKGMAHLHREVEHKFEAADDSEVPELGGIEDVASVEGPIEEQLEATYFDTSRLALAAAGISLRRRTGADDPGWYLKIPAGNNSRDEFRASLGGSDRTVPKPLRVAVQLYARGQDLIPIAQIRTHRSLYRLRDSEDQPLLEVCDDGVTAQAPAPPDTRRVTSWREWEIELVGGNRRHLESATQLLEHAGAQAAVRRSKLARVIGDRLPSSDDNGEAPTRRESPAAFVVRARLREQVAELKYRDPLVRRDAPDAVHKMRVAMRRLRSALATFRPLFDREQTEPLREELKWIAGVLGKSRDAEVMYQRLTDLVDEQPVELVIGPVKRRIDRELGTAYRTAHKRSVEAMQSERYFTLIDKLDALVADPPWTQKAFQTVESVLPARVRNDYGRLRRRVSAADETRDPTIRNERLHEARKAAKRARYAAEALEPVYGRSASQFAKAAKRMQSTLGDHHDAVVTQALLRQLGVQAHLDGENGFTYGRLHGNENAQAAALEAKYQEDWSQISRKKLRTWLS